MLCIGISALRRQMNVKRRSVNFGFVFAKFKMFLLNVRCFLDYFSLNVNANTDVPQLGHNNTGSSICADMSCHA